LLLLPIGAAYFAIYYVVFRWAIVRFNLSTPGREPEDLTAPGESTAGEADGTGAGWVQALGGAANLQDVDACTTRLRLTVADNTAVNEAMLRRLGARGFVRPSAGTLQVVVGPIADQLAGDIRAALRGRQAPATAPTAAPTAIDPAELAAALARHFGGRANIVGAEVYSTRLVAQLRDAAAVDWEAIESAARGAVRVGESTCHVIVGDKAAETVAALRALPA
jgi:PTS system N-acetylglucosamine-specific IIC component